MVRRGNSRTAGSSAREEDNLAVPAGGDEPRARMGDPAAPSVISCGPNCGSSLSTSGSSIVWKEGRVWGGGVRDDIGDGIAGVPGDPWDPALWKFPLIWGALGSPEVCAATWEVSAVREDETVGLIASSAGPRNAKGR